MGNELAPYVLCVTHVRAQGRTSSRSKGTGSPARSQRPYSSGRLYSRSSAASISADSAVSLAALAASNSWSSVSGPEGNAGQVPRLLPGECRAFRPRPASERPGHRGRRRSPRSLVGAVPVSAQQRGTVEFPSFRGQTAIESNLPNGQFGVFVGPQGSDEVKDGGSGAAGALGLVSVNTGVVSAPRFCPARTASVCSGPGLRANHRRRQRTEGLRPRGQHGRRGSGRDRAADRPHRPIAGVR